MSGSEAMSMLGEQIKELREAARNIQGNLGRCLYRRKDVDEMQQVSGMLFEAADTIESLRDKLQAVSETCEMPDTKRCPKGGEAMSVTDDLKFCPWCKSEADLVEMKTKCDGMTFWKVSCNDCHCMGANIHLWYKTKSEAIKAWNTRATLSSVECEDVSVVEWGTVPVKLNFTEDKSRYAKLFGTPERAARTLANPCAKCDDNLPCWECPLSEIIGRNVYEPDRVLVEWLRGDME